MELLERKISRLAPRLSSADVAILVASLTNGERARDAYRLWRQQLIWDNIPAEWQRLLPLLHQNLTQLGEQDQFLDRIKGVRRFMWAKNLRLIELAKTVLCRLTEAGVGVLVLKGTALVVSGYVDRSIRPMDDIDILIPADQMTRAIDVLSKLDLHPRFVRSTSLLNRVVPERAFPGWPFANSRGEEVDVHWSAMHLDRRIDSDEAEWSGSRTVKFEGVAVRVLSVTDQLINICAHGVRDFDVGAIRWIADSALIVRKSREIDWDILVDRARKHRLSAVMARALELLNALFDLSIDSQVTARLRRQVTCHEWMEVHAWNTAPNSWKKRPAEAFLELQQARRGNAELFDAGLWKVLRASIIAQSGTLGITSALLKRFYLVLGKPVFLRAILASDRNLALPPRERIPFLAPDLVVSEADEAMFVHGWSMAELSGRWTDGCSATIALRLAEPTRLPPTLQFEFLPATTEEFPHLSVSIFINDRQGATTQFVFGVESRKPVLCTASVLGKPTSTLLATFEISDPRRVKTSGDTSDPRSLGIFLTSMTIAAGPVGLADRSVLASADERRPPAERMDPLIEFAGPTTAHGPHRDSDRMNEADRYLLRRLQILEERVAELEAGQERLRHAYGRERANLRRLWIRPPMWTFEQHAPRPLDFSSLPPAPASPNPAPSIAIVTPSFNQARFLKQTIDSVVSQNYPGLSYCVQDGGSQDDSVEILKSYGPALTWRSSRDRGQSDAINLGFDGLKGEIMAYLNSDDMLAPESLKYVANFFHHRPDVDVVYGHRIFIDSNGAEIGRAVLPAHSDTALLYAGYIPQETMFWRRRVWDAIGGMDVTLHYALDWDFMLRALAAGFRFARARRFLACFRVHDEQKTTKTYDVGREEMQALRLKYLGRVPSQSDIYRAMLPYLGRQLLFHGAYKLGLLKQ